MIKEYGQYNSKFQALVAWVDQNGSIEDKQQEGPVEAISSQTGRNLHIGVYKLNGEGAGISVNVIVPVNKLGDFSMPRVGDVVWIEETRREIGLPPIYLYSSYNSKVSPDKLFGHNPVPQWGSQSGDYGSVMSYRDHIKQFVPQVASNFKKKFIKSITGYRFRSFYRGNLISGRFAVRGDSVFDIDGKVSSDLIIEDGAYVAYGGDLEADKGLYPNPLNVPVEKEEDEDYAYENTLFTPIGKSLNGSQYKSGGNAPFLTSEKDVRVLNNKNYMAYQPVMDKTYLDYAKFERELPAAEEYQVALRGNNKLLIQDSYGDGEQLLITLKNQYDAGFTVIHNTEKGQVRIRDHMGQGVLLEADPDAPRVISWTANRQVIEQGSVKGVGSFTYIRNGEAFGDSDTLFGTKTGLAKEDVSNQEFLMVSTPEIIGELGSRLSAGMNSLASSGGSAGVYIRNNVDPEETNQTWAMYKSGEQLTINISQENIGESGVVQNTSVSQTLDGSAATQTTVVSHDAPLIPHGYTETISATGADVTKTTVMTRASGETMTTFEGIIAGNTAIFTRDTVLPNANQITYTENTTTPTVTINVLEAGNPIADYVMSSSSIVTTKYAAGAPISAITQANGSTTVSRLASGLATPISIGADGGSGSITIGNALGPVAITGNAITVTGPTGIVGNTSVTGNIDATGTVDGSNI